MIAELRKKKIIQVLGSCEQPNKKREWPRMILVDLASVLLCETAACTRKLLALGSDWRLQTFHNPTKAFHFGIYVYTIVSDLLVI